MAKKIVSFILLIGVFLAAVISDAPSVNAAELECEILQYKLGRIYLGAGQEANIYPGCSFAVVNEADTLYTGEIEYAYQGVSLSRPTFGLTDTISLDKYRAVVQPAGIDSATGISLACYGVSWIELVRVSDEIREMIKDSNHVGHVVATTAGGNPVELTDGEAYTLPWDYEHNRYDGFFSASILPESIRGHATVVSSPAPFFAVLLPNLAGKAAEQGIVTTSLYYRFDVGQLWPTFFQSELPDPVNRLYIAGGDPPRSYPYDADNGRLLLSKHRGRPSSLSISYLNPRLENVAKYFADVLSRDRIRVEVKPYDFKADLFLTFVPLDWDDPLVSLRYIYTLLHQAEIKDKASRENLEIIGNYIQSAQSAEDVSTLFHFCRLADRALQHELGVFPLFRPSIHFVAGNHLKNISFDQSGYLDLTGLIKIDLPRLDKEQP